MQIKHLLVLFLFIKGLIGISNIQACELWELAITKTECNAGKFTVRLNFNHKDNSECFTITGNGKNYGKFLYANLPIIIDGLTGDCITDFEFQATDCLNSQCHVSQSIGKVCCLDCKISDLKLEKLPCDTFNKFFVILNFNHENTSHCFHLKINDHLFGDFEYSSLPIKIGPLEGDCITKRVFAVYDCEKPDVCNAKIELDKVCCNHDCKISNIKIEKTACDSLNMFFAVLSFKAENVSDSFMLRVNDRNFGKYVYGNPAYKIGPLPGDCITKFKFLIIDSKNTQCATDTLWGPVCCDTTLPCHLYDLNVEKSNCDSDNQFYVFINFKSTNTSGCFRIKGNGNNYGEFNYANLPIKLGPFKGDCTTNYEFLIQDCKNEHCAIEYNLGIVCCGTPPPHCQLADLQITKGDCNADNQFNVSIDFLYKNTSDCFHVFANGNDLGEFKYIDLPINLGPFKGDCHTEYVFVVKDCASAECHLEKSIGIVCCPNNPPPCQLADLVVSKGDCDSLTNQFFVSISFLNKYSSGCFHLYVNNDLFGEFKYSDLPLHRVGPFKGDCLTEYHFLIKDCANPDCHISQSIGTVCCPNNPPPCKLSELNVTKSDCDSNNQFFVKFDFTNKNTSGCFKLYVNNDLFGEFKYSDIPNLRVGPFNGDCKTIYNFLIKDCLNPDCHTDRSIGPVCCGTTPPCKVYDLNVKRSDCDDHHQFNLTLNFGHTNNSDCFNVYLNGGSSYGHFPYSSLPLTIGPFPGDCTTDYSVIIRDCKDEHCAADNHIGKVCCDTVPPPCHLYDLKVERTDCDTNKQFYVYFNFGHSNTSDCFRIRGNGTYYGEFNYSNLPIKLGPFNGDCITNYEFVIQDCKNERCGLEKNVGIVCCGTPPNPCNLSELKIEKTDCINDRQFFVTLNFHYAGVSECFHVTGNGHNYGEFKYGQLPLKLGPFTADCITNYEFGIQDCIKHDCHISANLGIVCCDSLNSKFYDVVMTRTDCEPDSTFKVKFNFHYRDVSDSFNIFINGKSFGTFGYNQLPVSAGPLLADCKSIYKIRLVDQKDSTIHLERVIEKPCCHPNIVECKIFEVKANPLSCTGPNEYALSLDFKYQGTTNQYFEVFDRSGHSFGYYSFNALPITIQHFTKSGREFDFINICENDNSKCCTPIEFRTIVCDSLINNPGKFSLVDMYVNTNTASNNVSIYSKVEIPLGVQIEMFNFEGRQIPIDIISRQPHEIFISSVGLTTDMYFIRLKSQDDTKTYKFFHIR